MAKKGGKKGKKSHRRYYKKKRSSKSKLPSISKVLVAVGAGAIVSGTVAAAAAQAMNAAMPMLAIFGIKTGAGIVAAAVAAKAACSLSPHWFAPKWRGFLRGWGFSP